MPAEKVLVKFLLAAVLALSTGTGLANVHYGAPPPDFMIPIGSGSEPLSSLRGKPVVINFWASWCPPCTNELPYFERLRQEYGDRVVLLTVDWNEAPGVAQSYLRKAHLGDLPVIEDPQSQIYRAYSLGEVPDTIVLNEAGNVSYVSVGGLSWSELQNAVDQVLGSTVPAPAPTSGS
jgi:thiol-disulfide isomerase/thioredoxin